MGLVPDLLQPSLEKQLFPVRNTRNSILLETPLPQVTRNEWKIGDFDHYVYVETTDKGLGVRLPNLSNLEGVFVGVGNPWKLMTQALVMKECQGVIMLDHQPIQTEVLLPLLLEALLIIPFSSDTESYIKSISYRMNQKLAELISDIQTKYPDLFEAVKRGHYYQNNFGVPELQKRVLDSLKKDFAEFGKYFILATQENVQKAINLIKEGKVISVTADLSDPDLNNILLRCLRKMGNKQIAAIDISNSTTYSGAHTSNSIPTNLERTNTLSGAIILHSDKSSQVKTASNIRDFIEGKSFYGTM